MSAADYFKFIFALIFVVSLMGGLAFLLKRFGHGGKIKPANRRRLSIEEILPLDSRHRAIILRRDNREHLVIIGPSGETVVETDITAGAGAETP